MSPSPLPVAVPGRTLRILAALVGLVAAVWAASPSDEARRNYQLPAGDAAEMLARLATESGREILFGAATVRGIQTHPVLGAFTAAGAAEQMLAGTDLIAVRDPTTGALAIRRRNPAPPASPGEDVAFATSAARPARAHRGPVMQALEPLLIQQARHLVSELQPAPAGLVGERLRPMRGPPSGEHGIRPNAHTAKGLALLVRLLPDDAFGPGLTRADARRHALNLLRFLLATQGASGGTCEDGRPWRAQWQSAYWAALAGEAGWLLWDDLDATERRQAARMVADEAERFVDARPPAGVERDSKAEENAWNSQILSLASLMFPRHPQAAAWRTAALRWIASSFVRGSDLSREDLVDGRPLRTWLTGATIHEDFTLENHQRVHPDYMACTYLLTSQAPMYAWGGQPPPQALGLNVIGIHRALLPLFLPDGGWLYPNGQDWGLRRQIDNFEYHTALAVLHQDPAAAAMQRTCLATMQRMAARQPHGSLYAPGETRLSSDEAMALEMPAHAYALMAERGEGPAPAPRLTSSLAGSHLYSAGKFGVLRTDRAIASFSWGVQVMGLVMPLDENLLLSPEPRGLIGYVGVPGGAREVPAVRQVQRMPSSTALGVSGELMRGGGAVEQRFAFLALPDGRTVYADVLRRGDAGELGALDLGTLGVLNDLAWPGHDGRRAVFHAGGVRVFHAHEAAREADVTLESPWFNLARLGIVRLAASGPARYVPKPTSAAGRLEQRFHLNTVGAHISASAGPGTTLARSVLVFYPGQEPDETRAAAGRCRLETDTPDDRLSLVLEDGVRVRIDLKQLTIECDRATGSK